MATEIFPAPIIRFKKIKRKQRSRLGGRLDRKPDEREEGLKRLAVQQGAKAELSSEEVQQLKAKPDYHGWYQDGQIIVEERDLEGVSGTKGQEDRPGLAHLISLIEQGWSAPSTLWISPALRERSTWSTQHSLPNSVLRKVCLSSLRTWYTILEELARKELAPFENVLTTTEVEMVREFLTDLSTRWNEIPNEMRNNFLRVILDRILVEETDYHFNVRIIWHSGFEQKLIVFRPPTSLRKRRWSEEEKTIIREHYPTASREELLEMLPGRPWHEIRRRAHRLKVTRGFPDRTGTRNPHWTPEEAQIIRDYDECRIAYTEMLEALEDRPYVGIMRRAKILGMDFGKRRIVWRFVDSFHDKKRSPVGRPCGWFCALFPMYGIASRSAVGKC